jgi:hypothetical protein
MIRCIRVRCCIPSYTSRDKVIKHLWPNCLLVCFIDVISSDINLFPKAFHPLEQYKLHVHIFNSYTRLMIVVKWSVFSSKWRPVKHSRTSPNKSKSKGEGSGNRVDDILLLSCWSSRSSGLSGRYKFIRHQSERWSFAGWDQPETIDTWQGMMITYSKSNSHCIFAFATNPHSFDASVNMIFCDWMTWHSRSWALYPPDNQIDSWPR